MPSTPAAMMKAGHYEKPFQLSVNEVPQTKIEHPDDGNFRVTIAGIACH